MNSMRGTALVVCIALSAGVGPIGASAQRGPGGRGAPGLCGHRYDPNTVETLDGEVVKVETDQRCGRGAGTGVHVTMKRDSEETAVYLGPSWYVDKQTLRIAPKDHIQVRGSRVTVDGATAIIAAEVKKGDQSLTLRDNDGLPMWRRGSGPPRRDRPRP